MKPRRWILLLLSLGAVSLLLPLRTIAVHVAPQSHDPLPDLSVDGRRVRECLDTRAVDTAIPSPSSPRGPISPTG